MFVCVFAKKFPALASQSSCEVSCPRAVREYEYRLLNLDSIVSESSYVVNKPFSTFYNKLNWFVINMHHSKRFLNVKLNNPE